MCARCILCSDRHDMSHAFSAGRSHRQSGYSRRLRQCSDSQRIAATAPHPHASAITPERSFGRVGFKGGVVAPAESSPNAAYSMRGPERSFHRIWTHWRIPAGSGDFSQTLTPHPPLGRGGTTTLTQRRRWRRRTLRCLLGATIDRPVCSLLRSKFIRVIHLSPLGFLG